MQQQPSRRPTAFKLSIADAFFLEELRATLSYAEAAQWLAEHVKSPGRSGPRSSSCSASPLCSPRRPHSLTVSPHDAPLPKDASAESVEAYMSKLSLELGADRGLLYTDAAHMVLDRHNRSPQKAVDIKEGLYRGGKNHHQQKWSSGFQVQDGCEPPRPREAVDTAARRAQPKLSSSWEGDDDRVLESRPREAVDAAAGRTQPKESPCWKPPLGWKLRPSSEHSRSSPVMTIVGAHGFQHQSPRLPRTRSN